VTVITHILNGDGLKHQLTACFQELEGSIIVMRECMIEGPVLASDFEGLVQKREVFLKEEFQDDNSFYSLEVLPELEKIRNLSNSTEVNLWFEDDLFCQLNLWYILYLLKDSGCKIFLVRPKSFAPYSFAAHSSEDLKDIFENRILLEIEDALYELWKFYSKKDYDSLVAKATGLQEKYPFFLNAVIAHLDRTPKENYLGRPKESLLQIAKELETQDFIPLFREFCNREAIYGYGDLQVKKMHEELF